eukprot:281878-Rhodomonas_salina.1
MHLRFSSSHFSSSSLTPLAGTGYAMMTARTAKSSRTSTARTPTSSTSSAPSRTSRSGICLEVGRDRSEVLGSGREEGREASEGGSERGGRKAMWRREQNRSVPSSLRMLRSAAQRSMRRTLRQSRASHRAYVTIVAEETSVVPYAVSVPDVAYGMRRQTLRQYWASLSRLVGRIAPSCATERLR